MLVKHLVNSSPLSQSPFVCLPADYLSYLTDSLKVLPRNGLHERAKKESLGFNFHHFQLIPINFWFKYGNYGWTACHMVGGKKYQGLSPTKGEVSIASHAPPGSSKQRWRLRRTHGS